MIVNMPEPCGARLAAKWLKKGSWKALHIYITVLHRSETSR
jgi:hypothetical protein